MKYVLTPIGDRIVATITEKQSPGGVLIPETVVGSGQIIRGKVLAIGAEVTRVVEGDYIHFSKVSVAGTHDLWGENHIVYMHEYDVLAKEEMEEETHE